MVSVGQSGGGGNTSYVWDAQGDQLKDLYGRLSDTITQGSTGATDYATNFLDTNLPGTTNAVNTALDPNYLQSITGGTNLGMSTMADMMNPQGNPYLQQSVDDMWGSLSKNYSENILPNQRSEASVIDNYGSSRDYIAETQLLENMMNEGTMAETAMRSDAYTTDQANALSAAGSYVGAGLSADQLLTNKGQIAPEVQTALMNLGMTPDMLPTEFLAQYSQILGAPTVLGEGSTDSGWNASFLT